MQWVYEYLQLTIKLGNDQVLIMGSNKGLMVIIDSTPICFHNNNSGERKLVVPTSLSQSVLRECHDIPMVGHVGMRRTLELVDR